MEQRWWGASSSLSDEAVLCIVEPQNILSYLQISVTPLVPILSQTTTI
jgi:hypothetical protein